MVPETHRDLEVWQASLVLAESIYRATSRFPDAERFGLTAQMRKAAISVLSNIAEGAARGSSREFARFLSIARGSLAELDSQVTLATRMQMLATPSPIEAQIRRTGQMLSALYAVIESRNRR